MNQKLYDDLAALRNRLKFKYMDKGRMPVVCTDEALKQLATKAPRQKKELEYITGLGKVFSEKYGDEFMEVLDAHNNRESTSKTLTHDVRMTLKNLENRLINVNKKNRLLYQPKLSDKTAIDLFSGSAAQNKKIIDLLLGDSAREIKLCDISDGKEESKKLYKRFVTIHREAQRTFRESGQLDLYIGYPYVIGKIFGKEGFEVRAPLALFPAELIKNTESFSFKIDDKRDVLFNNNLILCQYKFKGLSCQLPANTAAKENRKAFAEEMTNFYGEAGIKIDVNLGEIEKFAEYTATDFPKTEEGVFSVQNSAVLGRFSLYSSAMQKDFAKILEQNEINDNLHNLLDKEADEIPPPAEVAEEKLFYITDLNYSQEKTLVEAERSLVIQGPPGTGKSQAIVSIISDSVFRGKNVLMVSQKKAAIDVIYSRLGHLSRYALMIDDAKNKEAFYRQIYNLIYTADSAVDTDTDFLSISEKIERGIGGLDEINKELFLPDKNGTVPALLYAENIGNHFICGDYSAANKVEPFITEGLKTLSYAEIKMLRDIYKNKDTLADMLDYFHITEQYPFLTDLKPATGKYDRHNLKTAAEAFLANIAAHKKLNIFKRIGNSFKLKKELRGIFDRFFAKRKFFKIIYKNSQALVEATDHIGRLSETSQKADTLTPIAKEYGRAVYHLYNSGVAQDSEANQKVFDWLVFMLADIFDKENPELAAAVGEYNKTVAGISGDMVQKREMSRRWMRDRLYNFAESNIMTAKRLNEMKRAVESKRKPSVQKFVEKFYFELFKGIKIWIMTTDTVSEILPCEEIFDLVIFDEASQIYIEKTIPSFARAKIAVISGDHKQLRPSSLGVGRTEYDDESEIEEVVEQNAALEEESLLDLVRFKFNEVMLNYHYRSRYSELINFSNHVFYGGRLFVAPNTDIPPSPPIEVKKVDGLWVNRQNRAEAEEVVKIVKQIFAERRKNETIGIVTFNSNQRDLVNDLLDAEAAKDAEFASVYQKEMQRTENGEDVGLFIKNIENVQGDERDIMIFSVAYAKSTKDGKVVRNYGWLNNVGGENRLNVAVTRAKSKIYIVTSVTPEQLDMEGLTNDGPKIFKKYLEYAYAVSSGNPENINAVLQGFGEAAAEEDKKYLDIRAALITELKAAGYETETDIGVGGYKIDVAVKDENGKFLLGLEIDTSIYGHGHARERDLHRYRYLTAKGWKLQRIFSAGFDLKKETEKILAKLGK